jgi:hypothetical protein
VLGARYKQVVARLAGWVSARRRSRGALGGRLARSTDKRWKVLSPGAFKAKTVTMADTHEVDTYSQIAAEFMSRIFDLGSGDYLITDEADILGFASFDESDATEIWGRIEGAYGLTRSDVGSDLLIRIFEELAKRPISIMNARGVRSKR